MRVLGPDTCPFDITSHVSGTFLFFEYPDGSSKITVADVFVTWSNPLAGSSLTTTPLAGPFIVSAPNLDGTVTATSGGVIGGNRHDVEFLNGGYELARVDPSQ